MSNLLTEKRINDRLTEHNWNVKDLINSLSTIRSAKVIPYKTKQELINIYKEVLTLSSMYPFQKDDDGSIKLLRILEQVSIILCVLKKRHNMKVDNILQDICALINKANDAIN